MDVRSRWATNEPLFKRVIDHESGLSEFSGVQGFLMDKDIEFLQILSRDCRRGPLSSK